MKRVSSFIVAAMFAGQAWAQTTFEIGSLKYTVTDETNHYVSVGKGSTKPTGALNIQEKVTNPNDGLEYYVTSIGSSAFNGCSGLTSVTIPNTVTSIGNSAFENCSILTTVTIGNSVTSIGDLAFYGCSGLTSVTIPNSVTSIGSSAFDGCFGLTSVTIGNSVTSIGNLAFYVCSSLTEINVESNNTNYESENGVLFNKGKTELIYYPASKAGTTYTIGNSVTSISDLAFYCCIDLTTVTIPNSVTSIGYAAFSGCFGLTSVTIPNSVTSIGNLAFYGCSGLTSLCYEGSKEPTFSVGAFRGIGKTIPVCVPADYSSDSWCGFTNLYKGHDIVTDPATVTCTETGLTEGSHCSKCGRVFVAQEEVAALGHTVVADVAIDPTCTEPGKTAGKHCSVCNAVLEGLEVIPATGHTYNNTVTAPTCTKVGYTTHTCSVCEYTYYSDTIDAKGHKADSVEFENLVPATCTTAGSKDSVVFCSVCQAELSREECAIPALGHSYSNTITAPTCTAVGYTTHTCSVCEYTYNSDTVSANGHTYSTAVTVPTCIEVGYTTHTCSVCENTYNSDTVAANGHTEVTDAAVPATCTAAGKTEGKHCSVCETVLVAQEEIAALGHTEVTDAAIPATCIAAGKTEGKHCSVCNETIVAQTEIPALGHEFKDYVYNNDATTAADGTETATCERGCGATDTRTAAGTKLAETPEKGTAVAESAVNAVTIYAHHNTIVVENATEEISIYNTMGTLIRRDVTPCIRTEIPVTAPGVYIVKTGNVVKRVAVE